MKEVDSQYFCLEIKKADIICSYEHGYLIATSKQNPYQFTEFIPPLNSKFFIYHSSLGKILKLTQANKTILMAFEIIRDVDYMRSDVTIN